MWRSWRFWRMLLWIRRIGKIMLGSMIILMLFVVCFWVIFRLCEEDIQ
jgi:hypothetical protein